MSALSEVAQEAVEPQWIKDLTTADREVIRASDDVDALVQLRAQVRAHVAGRGRWLLWTWLLVLGGVTFSWRTDGGDDSQGSMLFVVIAVVIVAILIITYVARLRRRANIAEEWLSELDFRLAQLAARS